MQRSVARNDTFADGFVFPVLSLAQRDVVRFLRQPSRVVGGLATPVLFWILLGSGLGRSFSAASDAASGGYLEYAFTGTVVLIVLFTAIFSTISIIEDRNEGFLQSVLVSPAWRSSIAFGKVLGSALLATGHALVFLPLLPLVGIPLTATKVVVALLLLFVLSLALSGLGFVIAWRMNSTQGFHSVMNLFLVPLWLLSGAMFPASGASGWLGWIMAINPLSYGVAALRRCLEHGAPPTDPAIPGAAVSWAVTICFAAATLAISTALASAKAESST